MKMSVHPAKRLDAAEELALFEQWRVHRKGRAQIIEASLPLVAATAREFRCTSSDRSDLLAEGYLALLTAFERFDPARGVRFATYARHWVSSAMKAYLGRAHNALGSRAYARMNAKRRREALTHGSDGRPNAIAGSSVNTAAGPWGGSDLSLDAPLAGDTTTTLLDRLAADFLDAGAEIERLRRKAIVKAAVAEARATFDLREQVIFDVRFMADEDDLDSERRTATLDHAADKLGLSRERVRQLEERMRRKLADHLRAALSDCVPPDEGQPASRTRTITAFRPRARVAQREMRPDGTITRTASGEARASDHVACPQR